MHHRRLLPFASLPFASLPCVSAISSLLLISSILPLVSSTASAADKPAAAAEKTTAEPVVNKEELRKKLSPLQYDVTCNAATEPPFRNAYWDNHKMGLYVDVIDGEPLFASNHKFDSGSGWPSFFQPVSKASIIEKEDRTHNMIRVEVISKKSGAHLGHLFPDGPRPTGMRYCINSASLRFIPVAELEKEGYGKLRPLFAEAETQSTDSAAKPVGAAAKPGDASKK